MINFTLPEFYFNKDIIGFFTQLSKEKNNYFKYKVNFSSAYGNFPYAYWNGGYNNNLKNGVSYSEITNFFNNFKILPIRLNCSNICLEKNDLYDRYNNEILSIFENGINMIEFSNFEIYEILKEKYPFYNFILSKNCDFLCSLDINILNKINKSKDLYLISLPERFTLDKNFLTKIKKRSNIELTINPICNIRCGQYLNCQKNENFSQFNYQDINFYKNCQEKKSYENYFPYLSLEDIVNKYVPLGFHNFRINNVIDDNKDSLIMFLVNYFIKEEKKLEVYEKFFYYSRSLR